MKPFYVLLFSATALLLSLTACNASGSVTNFEEKIIGTWKFDEVKFKPDGKMFYADYSDGYQGATVTFKEGGTIEAYDKSLDTTATGFWYIDYYEEYDNDGNTKETIYYMVATLDIPSMNIFNDLLWDNLSISNSRLSAKEKEKDGGDYKYKLKK